MERWRGPRTRLGGEALRSERMLGASGVFWKKEAPGKRNATSNDNDDDSNSGNVTGRGERKVEVDKDSGGGNRDGGPPLDDCCPICFGTFTVPCKANCGHWYCGNCILHYWNYSAASKPVKCPMCSSMIAKLTPEASLLDEQEQEVTKVLKNVQRYNLLFVGGARGLLQKMRESPLLIKRMFQQMMDPDRNDYHLLEMRLFAMMLSILYAVTPFNFIPTALVLVLRLVGLYHRHRLTQRVRNLAAAQPLGE